LLQSIELPRKYIVAVTLSKTKDLCICFRGTSTRMDARAYIGY